jgi:hypothetical protein
MEYYNKLWDNCIIVNGFYCPYCEKKFLKKAKEIFSKQRIIYKHLVDVECETCGIIMKQVNYKRRFCKECLRVRTKKMQSEKYYNNKKKEI